MQVIFTLTVINFLVAVVLLIFFIYSRVVKGYAFFSALAMLLAVVIINPKPAVNKAAHYRYFMVNYKANAKYTTVSDSEGCNWFPVEGKEYPSKLLLDSFIYEGLPNGRNCYSNIFISSIHEFKNGDEFWAFTKGYKGNLHTDQPKQDCSYKDWIDTTINIRYNGIADTIILTH